jgi:aspartate/methionine/tyrosine aminotransferase
LLFDAKPFTIYREVLSGIQNTSIIKHLSKTSQLICKRYMDNIKNIGSYTDSKGDLYIRQNVSKYILKRDGFDCNPDNILLTNGATGAIESILKCIFNAKDDQIMIPRPEYPLYSSLCNTMGYKVVSYDLLEHKNWSIDIEQLSEKIQIFKDIKCMVLINPGNPTGQVFSESILREICEFCEKNNILILADEVYQENVFNCEFVSVKKCAVKYGLNTQVISIHSISKGFTGECGQRGGYMELHNIDDELTQLLEKTASMNLCSNITGQILVGLLVEEKDEKYNLEYDNKYNLMKKKAFFLFNKLNEIPHIRCNRPMGSMYLFPQIIPTPKIISLAKDAEMEIDTYYCMRMLDDYGICCVPGNGFGQQESTYHFRITFLPSFDQMEYIISSIKSLNNSIM